MGGGHQQTPLVVDNHCMNIYIYNYTDGEEVEWKVKQKFCLNWINPWVSGGEFAALHFISCL